MRLGDAVVLRKRVLCDPERLVVSSFAGQDEREVIAHALPLRGKRKRFPRERLALLEIRRILLRAFVVRLDERGVMPRFEGFPLHHLFHRR